MAEALDRLLELLDLEQIELDIFRGRSPEQRVQRVFGGQVAGQALVAAGRTVPADRPVHSMHAYFIRPGDPAVPLVYLVDRVRDGRSFTTRRVTAIQHGRPIFALSASFQHPEPGLAHADPMPDVPPPEAIEPTPVRLARVLGEALAPAADNPFDMRSVVTAGCACVCPLYRALACSLLLHECLPCPLFFIRLLSQACDRIIVNGG